MLATPKEAIDLFIWSRSSNGPIRAGHIGLFNIPDRSNAGFLMRERGGQNPVGTERIALWAKSLAGIDPPTIG
jgi:hypothetical protein